MTISPVANAGIEPVNQESGNVAPPTGFDVLLSGARPTDNSESTNANAPVHSSGSNDSDGSDDSDDAGNTSASNTDETGSKSHRPGPSATKPKDAADLDGLLAVLGALAWPAGSPDATPPPAAAPAPIATGAPAGTATPDPTGAAATLDLTALAALPDATLPANANAAGTADPPALPAAPAPVSLPALLDPPAAPATPGAKPVAPITAPAVQTPAIPMAVTGASGAVAPAHARSAPAPVANVTVAGAGAAFAKTTATTVDSTDDGTATTATVAPPPPAEQLVSVLSPLRTMSNGTYTLRLELKPAELGRVEMRVEMKDGVLHASIQADHEGSAQLLRDALGELRDRLAAEGVQTGDLTVSDGGVGNGGREGRDATPSSDSAAVATDDVVSVSAATAIPSTSESEATSLLDVRV